MSGDLGGRSGVARPASPVARPQRLPAAQVGEDSPCLCGQAAHADVNSPHTGAYAQDYSPCDGVWDQRVELTVDSGYNTSGPFCGVGMTIRQAAPALNSGYSFVVDADPGGPGPPYTDATYELIAIVATVETTIAGPTTGPNVADGDVFELIGTGTTITAKKNGVTVFSVTDSSVTGTGTNTNKQRASISGAGAAAGTVSSIVWQDYCTNRISP